MIEDLAKNIAGELTPALENNGFELVELKLARFGRSSRLQIFIEKATGGGITLDDCASVSRQADLIIEEKEYFKDKFTLEVSSPGIERSLHTAKDFARKIGRTVKVEFPEDDREDGLKPRSALRGILEEVSDTTITVKTKKETLVVALKDIAVGREYI